MREKDIEISYRWIQKGIYQPENYCTQQDKMIALDLNGDNKSKGSGLNIDIRNKERPRF